MFLHLVYIDYLFLLKQSADPKHNPYQECRTKLCVLCRQVKSHFGAVSTVSCVISTDRTVHGAKPFVLFLFLSSLVARSVLFTIIVLKKENAIVFKHQNCFLYLCFSST